MGSLRAITYFASVVCLTGVVWAQATSGELLGTVQDASGAIVVQANVKIRNVETSQSWEVQSNSTGRFRSPLLPVGSYEISVEKAGFDRYVRTGRNITRSNL